MIEWLEPRGLWALALLPLIWALSLRSRDGLSSARAYGSLALRALSVCALAFALARPRTTRPTHERSTVLLVDVSDSMDDASLQRARAFARTLQGHHVEWVTFAGDARITQSIARHQDGRSTNVENALAFGLGLLRADRVPELVLFSDGRETHGSFAALSSILQGRGVALWFATPTALPPEVGIVELALPSELRVGEPFAVRAQLAASVPMRVRARLLQNGAENATRELTVGPGETQLEFQSLVHVTGPLRYRLELRPDGSDRFAANNQFERATVVRGAPRVLVIEREREQAYALTDLLRAAAFELDLRAPEGTPERAEALREFDFVILSDVPAEALTRAAMNGLHEYVLAGGGLLIAGGERAFALGGYRGTPLEALSAVALETAARRDEPSLALMLAIDKSGSMAGEKLERAKEAAIATARLLPSDSYLGVLGFDTQPERVVRLSLASANESFEHKLRTLAATGGTALFPALDAAYAALAGVRARVKHVLLLTDGQTQEESLTELARSMRADGITISTIGLGDEVNRGLLSELARLGGGRAYFTRDPTRVPRLFSDETQIVGRPLTIEQRVLVQRAADAQFLRGVALERAPALRGYVASSPRAEAQLVLRSASGDPLLARMRLGSGWTLAWTSDLKPRWAAPWFGFRDFSRMLAQLVREHMRRAPEAQLPIEVRVEDDTLYASVDVLDEHARFVNGLTGTLELRDASAVARSAALTQIAPGRYQATIALPGLGSYALSARLQAPHDPSGPAFQAAGSVSHPFPAEYAPPFTPKLAELGALARKTGGGPLPAEGQPFAPAARSVPRPEERWPLLVWLALAAFLGDLTVRRAPAPRLARRKGT